jgi:exonuclease VII small subunit
MDTLEKLEIKVNKARKAVKRAKLSLRESINDYEKGVKKRVLKTARTKLKNAKTAYKAAKPKGVVRERMAYIHESVKNTARKIPVKRALTWTGLAVTTVATTVVGYLLYEYVNKSDESPAQDSM